MGGACSELAGVGVWDIKWSSGKKTGQRERWREPTSAQLKEGKETLVENITREQITKTKIKITGITEHVPQYCINYIICVSILQELYNMFLNIIISVHSA